MLDGMLRPIQGGQLCSTDLKYPVRAQLWGLCNLNVICRSNVCSLPPLATFHVFIQFFVAGGHRRSYLLMRAPVSGCLPSRVTKHRLRGRQHLLQQICQLSTRKGFSENG